MLEIPVVTLQWEHEGRLLHRDLSEDDRVHIGFVRQGALGILPEDARWALGRITAGRAHWRIDNLSDRVSIVASDLEDPEQYVRVPPHRIHVVMPFELTGLEIWHADGVHRLTVFGPEPGRTAPAPPTASSPGAPGGPDLPDTRYVQVLDGLLDLADRIGRLPSARDIAGLLSSKGTDITPRAVQHHLDYLVYRFGLTEQRGIWYGKCHAIVSFARRHGLRTAAGAARRAPAHH